MSSLKQYIDLYKENRNIIESHSIDAMNALREKAFAALEGKRLPIKGDENYEITDLEAEFATDYGVNINRFDFGADTASAFRCDVPNMSTWLYFSFNDTYYSSRTASISLPVGVLVGSIKQFANNHSDLIAKYYGTLAPLDNAAVALNTLLAQDGLLVYIPKVATFILFAFFINRICYHFKFLRYTHSASPPKPYLVMIFSYEVSISPI